MENAICIILIIGLVFTLVAFTVYVEDQKELMRNEARVEIDGEELTTAAEPEAPQSALPIGAYCEVLSASLY